MKKNKKSKNYKKMKKNNNIKKEKSDLKQTLKQISMGALFYIILCLIPKIITFNSRITLTIVILVSFIIIFYNGELFLYIKKVGGILLLNLQL